MPREIARHLASGTSALGAGVLLERGLGFAANLLAARLGGAATFGAYSLAFTNASQISAYAGGGIGATAARFSGKYPYASAGYPMLARALTLVSLLSAALAALALWLLAGPLAHLAGKAALTGLLRMAALSAAGIVLLECARGFFVGQRRLRAVLLLSVLVGVGMVALLPAAAAHHSPARMILAQGAVTTTAVLACLALASPLGLHAPPIHSAPVRSSFKLLPMLREIWAFGAVQLAGLVGLNLAGWWLTTLIARGDTTLVEMSFFAVANQLRNIVGLPPSLLTETSYSLMARESVREQGVPHTPDQVMALCTYLATGSSLLLSSVGIVLVPWALTALYGGAYRAAAAPAALGLAIAVVHMGNAPAAARLSIVSIRTTGLINTLWAVSVAAAGAALLLGRPGPSVAARAMAIYLIGHLLSAVLVLGSLRRRGAVLPGTVSVFALGTGTACTLAALAWLRAAQPALALPISAGMLALLLAAGAMLLTLGRRHHWLPSARVARALLGRLPVLGSRFRNGIGGRA